MCSSQGEETITESHGRLATLWDLRSYLMFFSTRTTLGQPCVMSLRQESQGEIFQTES